MHFYASYDKILFTLYHLGKGNYCERISHAHESYNTKGTLAVLDMQSFSI